eukprot:3088776-Prymnesium_polylepis.1
MDAPLSAAAWPCIDDALPHDASTRYDQPEAPPIEASEGPSGGGGSSFGMGSIVAPAPASWSRWSIMMKPSMRALARAHDARRCCRYLGWRALSHRIPGSHGSWSVW